jgi:hypothetical protein
MYEHQRKELIEKIAYKIWQIRTQNEEDNPLLGYGSKDTDYSTAKKIVSIFQGDILEDAENIKDHLSLFQDILENYFTKDYLSTYV